MDSHYFDGDDRVRLASLMDHAPGQRQFVNLETYAYYYQRKLKLSRCMSFNAVLREAHGEIRQELRTAAARRSPTCAASRGIVLASHDDATVAHVDEAVEQGIEVAEFPTTLEAAAASEAGGSGGA